MKKFRALHGPRSNAATRSGVCKPCKPRAAFEGCEQRLSPDQLQEVRFLGWDLGRVTSGQVSASRSLPATILAVAQRLRQSPGLAERA